MIRGVLFDMDGLLLDTERLSLELVPQAAKEMGQEMPAEMYFRLIGLNRAKDIQILQEAFGADFDAEEMMRRYDQRMLDIAIAGRLPFKKGYADCMAGLKARNIPCALATSTQRSIVEIYQRHNPALAGVFQAMVCGAEAPKGKPAPDIFCMAAAKLGLEPEECIGVEDSRNGLRALRAAGCYSVMIPDLIAYDEGLAPYVDTVLTDLSELCPLIDGLNGVE